MNRAALDTLTPMQRQIFAIIERAAESGRLCPSNTALSAAVDAGSGSTASDTLRRLERKGLIRVERYQMARRVTVCATGRSTAAPQFATPHWRDAAQKERAEGRAERARERDRERRAYRRKDDGVAARGSPDLADGEIARRAAERERQRIEHEQYWLREEQRKYGLPRKGRPLSEMIA